MHKSKDVLKSLSKIAADAYLKGKKTSLAKEIIKIAQQESVTPVQIGFLTAEANQTVWKNLYDLDKKASYSFKPVDPKEVLDQLQSEGPSMSKQASVHSDYLGAPQGPALDQSWNMSIKTYGTMTKTASERKELKHVLQNRLEKMALAQEQLISREITAESMVEVSESEIVKQAKQMIMELPFEDRPAGLGKIAEVVRATMLPKKKDKEAARLIVKISSLLKKHGLIKAADLKAPEQYINSKMPARIVNGRHPLYITIDTLVNRWNELDQIRQGREIVDSSLPVLKEKVRGL